MSHHSQSIVVDFDDTLAITLDRNWANATPNEALITKLNKLYREGWSIHVVTARGQLSCNGDSNKADEKYRAQIEEWLKQHDVLYTSLSFQKKLASYYIDDKGITPEDFVERFDRIPLKGGLSGAAVVLDKMSNTVHKSATNTPLAVEWYTFAEPHYNVPKIHSVIGDTIKMERLYAYNGGLDRILEVCKSFRNFPPLHKGILSYRYVDRCLHRFSEQSNADAEVMKKLTLLIEYATELTPLSFSHGDFSHSNIMSNATGRAVYLIDPINDPTLLSSWVIDLAKLYMSIWFDYGLGTMTSKITSFAEANGICEDVIVAHSIGHLCRMYPYADEPKREMIMKKIVNSPLFLNCVPR